MPIKLYIGAAVILLGLYSFRNSARMRKRSQRINGRVVRFKTVRSKHIDDPHESVSYIPVIAYSTPDGVTYECHGDSNPREPKIGTKIQLQYDPLEPGTAWERNSGGIYAVPFALTLVGIVLVGFGLAD